MRISKVFFLGFLVMTCVACTTIPQAPVSFSSGIIDDGSSVTIIMSDIPKPNMAYPGASCLLCLGVAAAANSDLSKYSKTLPTEDFLSFGVEVRDVLIARGVNAQLNDKTFINKDLKKSTSKEPNVSIKNHSVLKEQFDTTHLLVIRLDSIGMSRNYNAYIPTSQPYVKIAGAAYLVNLESNVYDWYLPITQQDYSDGEWNEKPDYPSLTNAYFGAIERVREAILSGIKN